MDSKEKQLTIKICATTIKNVDKWKKVVSDYKPTLDAILSKTKEPKESQFCLELQEFCNKLTDESIPQLIQISNDLNELNSKLKNLHELSNLSLDKSKSLLETSHQDEALIQYHDVICQQIESQLEVMRNVASNIGSKVDEMNHVVFLACCWTMQPHLNDDFFFATQYIKNQI